MFEEYLSKDVRVVKKDQFVKYGILVYADNSFIKLRFRDGRVETIAISEIASLIENSGSHG